MLLNIRFPGWVLMLVVGSADSWLWSETRVSSSHWWGGGLCRKRFYLDSVVIVWSFEQVKLMLADELYIAASYCITGTFPAWARVWMVAGINIQGNLFPTSRPRDVAGKNAGTAVLWVKAVTLQGQACKAEAVLIMYWMCVSNSSRSRKKRDLSHKHVEILHWHLLLHTSTSTASSSSSSSV